MLNADYDPQIREQMSGPNLHVFTLKFLALRKLGFFTLSGERKNLEIKKKGLMQLFSADAKLFSKKMLTLKIEKTGLKSCS